WGCCITDCSAQADLKTTTSAAQTTGAGFPLLKPLLAAAPCPPLQPSSPPRPFAPTLPPLVPQRRAPLRPLHQTSSSLATPPASLIMNGLRSRRSCHGYRLAPPSGPHRRSPLPSPRPASDRQPPAPAVCPYLS